MSHGKVPLLIQKNPLVLLPSVAIHHLYSNIKPPYILEFMHSAQGFGVTMTTADAAYIPLITLSTGFTGYIPLVRIIVRNSMDTGG